MIDSRPEIRRAEPGDLPGILAVATAALGWDPKAPNEVFFRWKHFENPAGVSPMWVAVDRGEIVGFRSMLRWRFRSGHQELTAVRAVDTATHPSHHRRGIFRSLTMLAVDELTAEGIDFVFNTPNDTSQPGYLTMGWTSAGKLPARLSLGSPAASPRLLGARTAAEKWSLPIGAGAPIESVIDDLTSLVPSPPTRAFSSIRSRDHLLWRYGLDALHYRVLRDDEAAAVIRLRRRGRATEAVLAELFAPDRHSARRLLRTIRKLPDVDYVLALGGAPHPTPRMLPIPGLGPNLTLRALTHEPPAADSLQLALGDVELF